MNPRTLPLSLSPLLLLAAACAADAPKKASSPDHIEGVVERRPAHRALRDLWVYAYDAQGKKCGETLVGRYDDFRLGPFPPGLYRIVLAGEGGLTLDQLDGISPGQLVALRTPGDR